MIRLEASFKSDFVTKAFFAAKFSVYGIGSYLKCADLLTNLHLSWQYLKICGFGFTFASFIELIILHICDMLWGKIIMCH